MVQIHRKPYETALDDGVNYGVLERLKNLSHKPLWMGGFSRIKDITCILHERFRAVRGLEAGECGNKTGGITTSFPPPSSVELSVKITKFVFSC